MIDNIAGVPLDQIKLSIVDAGEGFDVLSNLYIGVTIGNSTDSAAALVSKKTPGRQTIETMADLLDWARRLIVARRDAGL